MAAAELNFDTLKDAMSSEKQSDQQRLDGLTIEDVEHTRQNHRAAQRELRPQVPEVTEDRPGPPLSAPD